MNFDLTRQSLFTNILYILILSIIFWGSWLTTPQSSAAVVSDGTPLGMLIDTQLNLHRILTVIISFCLALFNSLYVTRLCVKNVVYLERSYMPALIYLLVSVGYYDSNAIVIPLLVSILLLKTSSMIFNTYNVKSLISGQYLNIGFLMGLAATLYAPALLLIPLVFIGLQLFRYFDIREWMAAIVGAALPLFFMFYTLWLLGQDWLLALTNYFELLDFSKVNLPILTDTTPLNWLFMSILAILVTLALISFLRHQESFKVKPRKAYSFNLWLVVLIIVVFAVAPYRSIEQFPILATPLAVIIPTFFASNRPTFITNFLYALLIFCTIAMHLIPILSHTL